jgi:DegV family protein with EDD domain
MKIQLMIDSTTDLPQDIIEKYNMQVVPLSVLFGEDEYFDLSPEAFYSKLAKADIMPVTSQVPPDRFIKAYEKALESADHIICITLSANASGTYQSAVLARNEVSKERITVIDSNSLCLGVGYLALHVAKLIEAGKPLAEIIDSTNDMTGNHIEHLFSVDTLEYLKKGGRLKGAKAVIAEVLNIKPILNVDDGITQPLGKVRSRKKVIGYYIKHMTETLYKDKCPYILIGHSLDLAFAKELETAIRLELNYHGEIIIGEIGAVIGTHTGPGVLAVFYYKK